MYYLFALHRHGNANRRLRPWFNYRSIAPDLTLCERVLLLTLVYRCTLWTMFSLDPSVVGLTSWRRTASPDHACAYLCHMIGKLLVFLEFLYIMLFELGWEVAFTNRSAVTHNKVTSLKSQLLNSCSERWIKIAFAGNSSLEPLLEGLLGQIHVNLSWLVLGRNQTGDLRITRFLKCGALHHWAKVTDESPKILQDHH